MKTLYICVKHDGLDSLLEMALSGHKELQVFMEKDTASLMNTIDFIGVPQLLIVDEDHYSTLDQSKLNAIPKKILFNKTNSVVPDWDCFEKSSWQEVCKGIVDELDATDEPLEYSTVPFHLLKSIETPVCDIYLEITKDGKPHHIKLFHKNEKIDLVTVEKYLDKGVSHANILTDDKLQFLNTISNNLYSQMIESPTEQVVGKSLDVSITLLKEIGFNSTSTQLLDGVIDNINKSLTKKKGKGKDLSIIKDLLNSKSSRYYKLANLTSLLSMRILQMSSWSTHTHQEILIYTALLGNVTLPKEEMIFITDEQNLLKSSFSDEEKKNIYHHALDAFNLVQADKDKPQDADMFILEHHGNKTGIGFAGQLSTQNHKLIIIFRICEDFSIELLKRKEMNEAIKLKEIFQFLYSKHDKKVLHQTIDLLKKCFIN